MSLKISEVRSLLYYFKLHFHEKPLSKCSLLSKCFSFWRFRNSVFAAWECGLLKNQHHMQIALNAQNKAPCSKRLNSRGTCVNEPRMVDRSILLRITGRCQIVVERTPVGSPPGFNLFWLANTIAALFSLCLVGRNNNYIF